jgi:hypothetical protein
MKDYIKFISCNYFRNSFLGKFKKNQKKKKNFQIFLEILKNIEYLVDYFDKF